MKENTSKWLIYLVLIIILLFAFGFSSAQGLISTTLWSIYPAISNVNLGENNLTNASLIVTEKALINNLSVNYLTAYNQSVINVTDTLCINNSCIDSWNPLNQSEELKGVSYMNQTNEGWFGITKNLSIGNAEENHYIYFYEDGKHNGEYIAWDNTFDRFNISDSLNVEDYFQVGKTSYFYGDLHVRSSDLYLGTDSTDNCLSFMKSNGLFEDICFDITDSRFEMHDDLYIWNDLFISFDFWVGSSDQDLAKAQINSTGNAKFGNVSGDSAFFNNINKANEVINSTTELQNIFYSQPYIDTLGNWSNDQINYFNKTEIDNDTIVRTNIENTFLMDNYFTSTTEQINNSDFNDGLDYWEHSSWSTGVDSGDYYIQKTTGYPIKQYALQDYTFEPDNVYNITLTYYATGVCYVGLLGKNFHSYGLMVKTTSNFIYTTPEDMLTNVSCYHAAPSAPCTCRVYEVSAVKFPTVRSEGIVSSYSFMSDDGYTTGTNILIDDSSDRYYVSGTNNNIVSSDDILVQATSSDITSSSLVRASVSSSDITGSTNADITGSAMNINNCDYTSMHGQNGDCLNALDSAGDGYNIEFGANGDYSGGGYYNIYINARYSDLRGRDLSTTGSSTGLVFLRGIGMNTSIQTELFGIGWNPIDESLPTYLFKQDYMRLPYQGTRIWFGNTTDNASIVFTSSGLKFEHIKNIDFQNNISVVDILYKTPEDMNYSGDYSLYSPENSEDNLIDGKLDTYTLPPITRAICERTDYNKPVEECRTIKKYGEIFDNETNQSYPVLNGTEEVCTTTYPYVIKYNCTNGGGLAFYAIKRQDELSEGLRVYDTEEGDKLVDTNILATEELYFKSKAFNKTKYNNKKAIHLLKDGDEYYDENGTYLHNKSVANIKLKVKKELNKDGEPIYTQEDFDDAQEKIAILEQSIVDLYYCISNSDGNMKKCSECLQEETYSD